MKTSLKTRQQGKSFFQPLLATLITLLVVALGANPALARGHGHHGGHRGHDRNFGYTDHEHDPASDIYTSPGLKITTANQVNALPDGEGALLKGHIVGQVGGDEFLFRDNTGMTTVLINQGDWRGLQAGPSDLVEIHGRIVHSGAGAAVREERIATTPA